MDSLARALRDACADLLKGDPPDEVIAETSAAHGLRPELLRRKLEESYGPPETLFARQGDAAAQARARFLSGVELDRWFDGWLRDNGLST